MGLLFLFFAGYLLFKDYQVEHVYLAAFVDVCKGAHLIGDVGFVDEELLEQYRVARCYYGHLHGPARRLAIEGEREGVRYKLVSADHVDFQPWRVL